MPKDNQQEEHFANLNKVQYEAVHSLEGPLLILAGAGTGKTKVLTSRVVNILNSGLAKTSEVLAVTFTNKAAKEMKERIENMLGYPADGFWLGTFHSIGLRILRRHTSEAGLNHNFTILDPDDCEKILKQILLDKNLDIKKYPPRLLSNTIAKLKDKNFMPDAVPDIENKLIGTVSLTEIYAKYQQRLRDLNAVDFGDLILLCIHIFAQFPDILEYWQTRFRYIMVDEYQDTNTIQYIFIRLLGLKHQNVCCVGDDDQSIYSWRGAEINNILRFEKDFIGAKVLRLEQNYRSTLPILQVAASLIANNTDRWEKSLWSEQKEGAAVKVYETLSSKLEAETLCNIIMEARKNGYNYKNIGILVRAIFQTRQIEESLLINEIPYKIVGGNKFYDRLEIKDAIAYLRLLYQHNDDMAYFRIINTPKRGIGEASIMKIRKFANEKSVSMLQASKLIIGEKILSAKVEKALQEFTKLFVNDNLDSTAIVLTEITKELLENSGYIAMWQAEEGVEAQSRLENINELYSSLKSYQSLEEFLEHVSLVSDHDDEYQDNKVSLMTLHAAKGLEFDVVLLPGWEDGLLPHQRSLEDNGDLALQEERRLAYVGITRAKKELYITYAQSRQAYGNWTSTIPSRFLAEIDKRLVKQVKQDDGISANERIMQDPYLRRKLYGNTNKENNFVKSNYQTVENIAQKSNLQVGYKVKHTTMGEGIIEKIQGPIATVRFANNNIKKIMVTFLKKA
ncbi:ATP-dependent DNA helicase PcrA [Candidatus Hepatincola sp. Av]